ncbi:TadE/TadG family type IV pilus assembly protein [Thalassobacillus hwangdonensis]|uniref:TadE/TadG family type IV pilus assembly protein n=1 Tax=Thalassobacillus hwangdonensis TaxID=546108 RepID=A0ABW3L1V9_9BACI
MIKDEKGQSLVELALILPVLLLLLVGIIDFGRMLYSYTHLHMASQEAVRVGGLGGDDQEIGVFARDYITFEDKDALVVDISPGDSVRKSGEYVEVTLKYPFEMVTPIIDHFFTDPLWIETSSTIRVE